MCLALASILAFAPMGCSSITGTTDALPFEPGIARGVVFRDDNTNGVRDPGERGLRGVRVSNGDEIVTTDRGGRYTLPIGEEGLVFVIKPTGMMTAIDERFLPRFYHLHRPAGSPSLLYPGVPATGPLPASIDFPLTPQHEPKRFRVLLIGDPQPYDRQELGYFARDVVEELPEAGAAFGVSLGDLVGDDLALFDPMTRLMSLVGVPWYNVLGNHDINYDAADDAHSDETFERVFGPPDYAFEYSNVHFIVLDNVRYRPRADEDTPPGYTGALDARQLRFVEHYLASVSKHERVVVLLHIPLADREGRCDPSCKALLKVLERHPLTLSISGHTHVQAHHFISSEEDTAPERAHHHWNAGAASGSWWSGAPDHRGIPHATMRDGAPNGYSIATFEGDDYAIRFKAAGRPSDEQMNIDAPQRIAAEPDAPVRIHANVFAGSERSRVEIRLVEAGSESGGAWQAMKRVVDVDPAYRALYHREGAGDDGRPRFKLPKPEASRHLWVAALPPRLDPGAYWIEVRSTDMFGQVDLGRRALWVEEED